MWILKESLSIIFRGKTKKSSKPGENCQKQLIEYEGPRKWHSVKELIFELERVLVSEEERHFVQYELSLVAVHSRVKLINDLRSARLKS